jgi:hypothetical protein
VPSGTGRSPSTSVSFGSGWGWSGTPERGKRSQGDGRLSFPGVEKERRPG